MAQFLLLLHEDPSLFSDISPEEGQRIVGEYGAWREKLEVEGRLVGANKLKDEGGRSLKRNGTETRIVDGPYAEAKEICGGYFMITADDYDDAVEISRGCPHLQFGGRIELREVDLIH